MKLSHCSCSLCKIGNLLQCLCHGMHSREMVSLVISHLWKWHISLYLEPVKLVLMRHIHIGKAGPGNRKSWTSNLRKMILQDCYWPMFCFKTILMVAFLPTWALKSPKNWSWQRLRNEIELIVDDECGIFFHSLIISSLCCVSNSELHVQQMLAQYCNNFFLLHVLPSAAAMAYVFNSPILPKHLYCNAVAMAWPLLGLGMLEDSLE